MNDNSGDANQNALNRYNQKWADGRTRELYRNIGDTHDYRVKVQNVVLAKLGYLGIRELPEYITPAAQTWIDWMLT